MVFSKHYYGKLTAYCLFAIMLLMAGTMRAAAGETEFDRLLKAYEDANGKSQTSNLNAQISAANALFLFLDKAKFTDTPIQFKAGIAADSLRMMTDYWAAEYLYNEQQQADRAIRLATRALPLCRASKDPDMAADCLALLSACHFRKGEWKQAADYAKELYKLDQHSGDNDRISSSLNTLAGIYLGARQPREAEKYIVRAINASKKTNNLQRQAVILGMASEIYQQMGNADKALEYARQGYALEEQLGRKGKAAIRLSQMAAAHMALHHDKEAKEALEKAIPALRSDSNKHSLAICLNQMGELLLKEQKNSEAAKCFTEALQLHIAQGDLYNESNARKGLYNALKDSDPQAAMRHIERYNELKDSIYDRETGEVLSKYNAQYGNEQLQEDNELQRQQKRRVMMTALATVLALIIIIGVLIYVFRRRYKGSRKENSRMAQHIDQLRQQQRQLKEKYANIIASNRSNKDQLADEEKQFIDRIITISHKQMAEGKVDFDDMAAQMCMSASNLRRRITKITGETPANYLLKIRLQEARHLIDTQSDLSIADVAMRCGFDDSSNFARAFRRVFGVSPSEYQHGEQKS
ncbi:MAG: helix-turn-helix domain-containing protein [Prevotella sp.]|nr:helix-turn-helix domain-containing protein [Prevotella sp.]